MNAPTSFGGMTLQADKLGELPGIRHAFFTRVGGVSEGIYATLNAGVGSNDARERVAENRARMAAALGCPPDNLLSLYQIHSPTVVVADKPWPADARPRADGVVTQIPGLAIAASTADCGPVLFADPEARVIGAAHAGWRGALGGVVEATIAAMERLGAARPRIHAAIGPMIRQSNYEVGTDLVAQFTSADAANARFFVPRGTAGPFPVRPRRLRDVPARARRHRCVRGLGALHLCRPGAVLQLSPHDPSRRARLRAAPQRDHASVTGKLLPLRHSAAFYG